MMRSVYHSILRPRIDRCRNVTANHVVRFSVGRLLTEFTTQCISQHQRTKTFVWRLNMPSLYLPTGQAARHLGIGPDTLRRWAENGQIRHERTASGRYLFDVIGYLRDREQIQHPQKN